MSAPSGASTAPHTGKPRLRQAKKLLHRLSSSVLHCKRRILHCDALQAAGAAAVLSASLLCAFPAVAELNKFEQAAGGE